MKLFKFLLLLFIFFNQASHGSSILKNDKNWQRNIALGANKTVNFHAWGGSPNINEYIKWVGKRVKKIYNISLKHIKIKEYHFHIES